MEPTNHTSEPNNYPKTTQQAIFFGRVFFFGGGDSGEMIVEQNLLGHMSNHPGDYGIQESLTGFAMSASLKHHTKTGELSILSP